MDISALWFVAFFNVLRYLVMAGLPFLIFYWAFPQFFSRSKIQRQMAQHRDFIREFLHSILSIGVVVGVLLVVMEYSPLRTFSRRYDHLSDMPLWWIPVSILLAMVVHDTYFYWLHRIIHHPRLFRLIHALHHRSRNPSPLAAYSLHIIEAILESLMGVIILLLIPMHMVSIMTFSTIALLFNVYGHLGYEIVPLWFRHSWLFELLNTSVHHNLHHEQSRGNYGYYFRIWDRLMGTENPDYVRRFDQVQAQRKAGLASAPAPLPK